MITCKMQIEKVNENITYWQNESHDKQKKITLCAHTHTKTEQLNKPLDPSVEKCSLTLVHYRESAKSTKSTRVADLQSTCKNVRTHNSPLMSSQ